MQMEASGTPSHAAAQSGYASYCSRCKYRKCEWYAPSAQKTLADGRAEGRQLSPTARATAEWEALAASQRPIHGQSTANPRPVHGQFAAN